MLSEQQIIELAEGYVCPFGKHPTTQYEINKARQYAEFARIILNMERENCSCTYNLKTGERWSVCPKHGVS